MHDTSPVLVSSQIHSNVTAEGRVRSNVLLNEFSYRPCLIQSIASKHWMRLV